MTKAHMNKLQNTSRCPCCGADRIEMELDATNGHATVTFACKSSFTIANHQIIPASPCHAGTQLAAHLLNYEINGGGKPQPLPAYMKKEG